MFGTIRKHQNWLWIVIIAVIIISFVVFFSPDVQLGGNQAAPRGIFGSINGKPIGQEEYLEAYEEARLGHFMRTNGREWPGSDDATERALERDAVYRVFLKHKIRDMDIHVTDEAVGRLVRERLGNYPIATFAQEHLAPQRLTEQDFARFMRREAALQQLVTAAGATAKLLNPREAEILYRKENEQALTEVALFSATNYVDKVTVEPAAVSNYFNRSMALYRVPERIQVGYVAFPATNYFAEADKQIASNTNLDAQIEEFYYKRGTNTFKGTNETILSAEEAKKRIREDLRLNSALLEARRKANEFGTELLDQPQPDSLATFEKLAAAKGFPVKVTEPFDARSGLDTNFPPEFRQKALTLNTNTPVIFNPIVGEDAVFLIALKTRVPSQMPEFDKVKDKVTADYKQQQAVSLARGAATNFYATVTNALLQKKTFAEVARAQNVNLITPPPFAPSTTTLTNLDERLRLQMLQQFAFEMKPGDVTGILPLADGAMLLHLRERKPVDDAKVQAELPEFLNRIRLYRHNEAFNQWFRKQAEQARVVVPQREPSIMPGQPTPQQTPQTRS